MYDFQSLSRDMSFARIKSVFRRSFKRPSELDSGRTHLMISIQSLSFIVAGFVSCLSSDCWAAWSCFARLSVLVCDCAAIFCTSNASCSLCARRTTLAFPILVPQTFHNADAEKEPFFARSCLTWSASSASHSMCCWAIGILQSKTPALRPCSSATSTSLSYWTCSSSSDSSPRSCCPNSCRTFRFFTEALVKGTNPTFAHDIEESFLV